MERLRRDEIAVDDLQKDDLSQESNPTITSPQPCAQERPWIIPSKSKTKSV